MLTKRIKASKKPLIVRFNNTPTQSQYEVKPINLNDKEFWLPIEINYGDPIYKEAEKYHEFPACGIAYAVPIKDIINKYWEAPIEKPKEEKINWA